MSKLLDRESQLDTLRRKSVAPAKVPPAASTSSAESTTVPEWLQAAATEPAAMPVQAYPARRPVRIWVRLPKLALAGLAAFWLSRPFVEPLMPLELPPPDAPMPLAAAPAPDPAPTVVTIEVVDAAPVDVPAEPVEQAAAPAAETLMPDILGFEEFQPVDLVVPDSLESLETAADSSGEASASDTAAMPAEPAAPAPEGEAVPASMEPEQEVLPAPAVINSMDMAMERANDVYSSMDAALQEAARLSQPRQAKQPRRWWKFGGS